MMMRKSGSRGTVSILRLKFHLMLIASRSISRSWWLTKQLHPFHFAKVFFFFLHASHLIIFSRSIYFACSYMQPQFKRTDPTKPLLKLPLPSGHLSSGLGHQKSPSHWLEKLFYHLAFSCTFVANYSCFSLSLSLLFLLEVTSYDLYSHLTLSITDRTSGF